MFCDGGRSVHSEATEKNDDLDKPRYKDPSGLKRQIMVLIRCFFLLLLLLEICDVLGGSSTSGTIRMVAQEFYIHMQLC